MKTVPDAVYKVRNITFVKFVSLAFSFSLFVLRFAVLVYISVASAQYRGEVAFIKLMTAR
jgi:hypothetical protein